MSEIQSRSEETRTLDVDERDFREEYGVTYGGGKKGYEGDEKN